MLLVQDAAFCSYLSDLDRLDLGKLSFLSYSIPLEDLPDLL